MNKKAYVFDLDDTLIKTNAKIYLYDNDDQYHSEYSSFELKDAKSWINEKLEEGYKLNFDEIGEDQEKSYHYLKNGEIIDKYFNKFHELYIRGEDIFILTGRGNDPEIIKRVFEENWSILIDLNKIITVANKNTFDKIKNEIYDNYYEHPILESFFTKESPLGSINKKKKLCLFYIIQNGYDHIEFYDDDIHNYMEAEELKNELKKYNDYCSIKIDNYLV